MGLVSVTAADVYVNKGFGDKPQVSFKAREGSAYGTVTIKISNKKYTKKDEKAKYDNYTVQIENVKSDAKIIEMLGQPGVKVTVTGLLTQEEFNNVKYDVIRVFRTSNLQITNFGNKTENADTNTSDEDSGL